MITTFDRARPTYDLIKRLLYENAGISVNLGKTESFSKQVQNVLPGMNELGSSDQPPIFKGNLTEHERGIEILGAPIGTNAYVNEMLDRKLVEQDKLLDSLPHCSSVQHAWLLLYYCGIPRSNHLLRTIPPETVSDYAGKFDRKIKATLSSILRLDINSIEDATKHMQLELPLRLGGMGLRNNRRISPCAYWASWADSLKLMCERNPRVLDLIRN